jgi:PiT family inorganic phosphate transporter
MLFVLLLGVTLFLAYANGANDNFKGVSTLYGSNRLSYADALKLAAVGQVAGSALSVLLADTLVKAFTGEGLVSPDVSASNPFLISVGLGACATVMLATALGFPISTTHALTGALVGAAFIANLGTVDLSFLGQSFVLPLLMSPVLAALTAMPLYRLAHRFANANNITRETCICVAPAPPSLIAAPTPASPVIALPAVAFASPVTTGTWEQCNHSAGYGGHVFGMRAQGLVDALHRMSALALCFARGLNDTPKIFALLFAANLLRVELSLALIAFAMALGGYMNARKVAEKMSKEITTMNEGQALMANLVASSYVILASKFGLPVSTTHVTVGAIAGVGIISGNAHFAAIRAIIMSWVLTLPVAAMIGAAAMFAFKTLGN